MTAPVDRDREELARVLYEAQRADNGTGSAARARMLADALAPVIARREARAAAKALEGAAADYWRHTTLTRWPDVVVWLRARAAALDTEGNDHER